MASRLERRRRWAAVAGSLLLGAAGCAFPNGTTGGDPLLGSFNRPIVPTPPPERAGLGPATPAYDAGARIGVTNPDVPASSENPSRPMIVPTPTGPNPISGARLPGAAPYDGLARRQPPVAGARLPMPTDGSPRTPSRLATELASYEPLRDPAPVRSMEEGQSLLQALGAKAQRTEQREDGDWVCACTIGPRPFEARAREPLEAMRRLLEQVRVER